MPALKVLVIDDEANIRHLVATCLREAGCVVVAVADAAKAAAAVAREPFDAALLDLRLGAGSGLDLLPTLLAERPELFVILMTAYATVETAVEAMRRGARDYLAKPFTPAQLRHRLIQVEERVRLGRRVDELERRLRAEVGDEDLRSTAPAMAAALDLVDAAAGSDANVLLRGESGVGKGVLARRLHARSARRDQPFVVVDCPTLTEELLASELFGHAEGAFTGAVRDQAGRVEAAEGGTLFLDEVTEIPPTLQAKLLRFLQDRAFERVGESRTRSADVRVVAATNRDLDAEVAAGRFRQDLFYRLAVVEIAAPPLRERRDDILPLARRFLALFARGRALEFSAAAGAALIAYDWPGNVRELRNAIERAAVVARGAAIAPADLPARLSAPAAGAAPAIGADLALDAVERAHVLAVVARHATQEDAARVLGIDPSTLHRKLKRWQER